MDTPPEEALDDLAELAAAICGAPIGVVSLVGVDHLWFKARMGMEEVSIPRAGSYCDCAVLEAEELLIVPDTKEDPRFANYPAVLGGGRVRFYAGAPLTTPAGAVLGTLCVIDHQPRTLTEEQQKALRTLARQVMTHLELSRQLVRVISESEARLKMVTDHAPVALVVLNREHRVTFANPAYAARWDKQVAEVIGRPVAEIVGLPDAPKVKAWLDRAFAGERMSGAEERTGASGTYFAELLAEPHFVDGEVVEVVGVIHDITERRKAETELMLFRTLVDQSSDIFEVTDAETGRFLDVNQKGSEAHGYTRAEYLRFQVWDVEQNVSAEAWPELRERIRTAGIFRMEGIRRRKDGTSFPVEVRARHVVLDREYFVGSVRDVSRNKAAEEELESNRRFLFDLIEHSGSLVYAKDRAGRYLLTNQKWGEVTGIAREQALQRTDEELFSAADAARFRQIDEEVISSGETRTLEESLSAMEGGRSFLSVKFPLRDAAGIVVGMCGMTTEITERKKVEEALRLEQERLAKVAAMAPCALFSFRWRPDGTVHFPYVSPAMEEMFALSIETLHADANPALERGHPDEMEELRQSIEVSRRGMTQWNVVYRLIHPQRGIRWVEARSTPQHEPDGGVIWHGAVMDVTERKEMERQLFRNQRVESIGTLAGGIAHDLNNVFGPIIMSLGLLRMRFPDAESRSTLEVIESSAQHGAEMVRQILTFARGVKGQRLEVQMGKVLAEVAKVANDTFLKSIEVQVKVAENLSPVVGDPTQLHQVLLNLCVNARDAMLRGGKLSLSAHDQRLDAQSVELELNAQPGPYVCVEVEDTGSGMPPEIVDRIFDPFFTTKDDGQGTGLGLSTSLAIVQGHGGFVRVRSTVGQGTRFQLFFPVGGEAVPPAAPVVAATLPQGHGELILIVDDEVTMRTATEMILTSFGYRAVLAVDGTDAVRVFSEHLAEIAVVVTDMMMPGLDGAKTIEILQAMNPKIRIVVVSGLLSPKSVAAASALGVKHFLPKPYSVEALLETMRQSLTAVG